MTFRYAATRSSASRIPPGARSLGDQAVVFLALEDLAEEDLVDDPADELADVLAASSGELTPVSELRRARALR